MSAGNFQDSLAFTWLPNNDGEDEDTAFGGAQTRWGVEVENWTAWAKAHRIKTSFAKATKDQFAALIQAWYWNAVQGESLPRGVDLMVFDFGFTAGPGTSARILQEVVGVDADGQIGPQTMAAVIRDVMDLAGPGPAGLITSLSAKQTEHYESLGEPMFLNGWLRRTTDRQAFALNMLKGPQG